MCVRAKSEIRANQGPRQSKSPRSRVSEARRCFDERARISKSNSTGDPICNDTNEKVTVWVRVHKNTSKKGSDGLVRIYALFKAGQGERIIQSLNARNGRNVLIHMYLSTLAGVHVILTSGTIFIRILRAETLEAR